MSAQLQSTTSGHRQRTLDAPCGVALVTLWGWILCGLLVTQAAAQNPDPFATNADAQAAVPLYEVEPYDRLHLKDDSIVEVQPVNVLGRRMPIDPRPTETIEVRLVSAPDTKYRVTWGDIVRIEFFEQMLLDEAAKLIEAEDFDGAFEYFRYLIRNHPDFDGLQPAVEAYLFREAQSHLAAGRSRRALALLLELSGRNSSYPGLQQAFGEVLDPLISGYVNNQQFVAARLLIGELQTRYPNHAVAQRWSKELGDESAELLALARTAFEAGQVREAHESVRAAIDHWPQTSGARELFEQVYRQYPYVTVGVAEPAPLQVQGEIYHWGARRVGRLTQRSIMELTGYGAEGGTYRSPFGKLELADLGLGATLRLQPNTLWSDGQTPLTGYHISRLLLSAADRTSPRYEPLVADLLGTIDVRDVYEIDLRFRYSHVHPATLLAQTLRMQRPGVGETVELTCGPFQRGEASAEADVRFMLRQLNLEETPTAVREISERYYPALADSIDALNRGEIAIVDRVNPWELSLVAEAADLRLARYALPTVHCLIPNPQKPLTANRTFRRAILYGLDRTAILQQGLFRGANPAGSRVISGPFVRGVSFDDPRGYGYDEQIEPRAFDPKLALTLIAVALQEVDKSEASTADAAGDMAADASETEKTEGAPAETKPSAGGKQQLTLAHAPGEIATRACTAIASYLAPLGLQVQLVELPPGATAEDARQYDLWFVELAAWEPVIDAHRLFAAGGPAETNSPYMALALRRLAAAANWRDARQQLMAVHRLVHDELPLIPLWQLTEHFAYHQRLAGVGDAPVKLYQNVEQWQVAPWFPTDAN